MRASFFSRQKRSLAFSSFILLILGIFILGYFYYFIPVNKDGIHKNGFLILHAVASNIQGKSASHLTLFHNFYNTAKNQDGERIENLKKLLKENNVEAAIENKLFALKRDSTLSSDPSKSSDSLFYLAGVRNGSFVNAFKMRNQEDSIVVAEPIQSFLSSILSSQKTELFGSYLLAQSNGKQLQLVYKDAELGIRSDIDMDSLLPGGTQAYLAGIRDVTIEESGYKMFYFPFDAGANHLVLCGLVKTQPYNASVHEIPFYFIYPLIITFLLLLVLLPILKFYIMDSNEQVRLRDFFMFCLSVFIGASLITLIIIQYLLWKAGEERAEAYLSDLSGQIEKSFSNELVKNYNQLSTLDSLVKTDSLNKALRQKDISKPIFDFLVNDHQNPRSAYLFSRVTWIDSSGAQIKKAELYGKPVFTNVSDRKYFQAFKNDDASFLPDGSGRKFSWEALYSWTNEEYSISISKQSAWKGARVAALATKMYPVVNALLPSGYSFCIINKEGEVQIHSDPDRNLRENLFEKIESPREIEEAVAGRQAKHFKEVNFYGRRHLLYIKPIPSIPFYILTFYDEAFIVSVNMRILIFSVLFCFFSFVITLGLFLALIKRGFYQYPLLYSFMDCLSWVAPQEKGTRFYFHGFLFLTAYITTMLLFIFLFKQYHINNYVIFTLVVLTPFNVLACLFVIHTALLNPVETARWKTFPASRKKAGYVIEVHFMISLACYSYALIVGYPIEFHFLLFQVLLTAVMCCYGFATERLHFISYTPPKSYLSWYSWMVTAAIICLSVLPAALFTWYAHNQEINQNVKKQQLYLAESINKRSKLVVSAIRNRNPAYVTDSFFTTLPGKRGMYTIYKDTIKIEADTTKGAKKGELYERFYFTIANKVGNRYYDPQLYPALADSSADKIWYWQLQDSLMHFWYTLPLDKKRDRSLHIISKMPDRYTYVNFSTKSLWLLALIVLLVWSLRKWIRINAEQLFLKKYIQTARKDNKSKPAALLSEFYADKDAATRISDERLYTPLDYQRYGSSSNRQELDSYEKEILGVVNKGRHLYDYIWGKCTEKEKYLLFDFAKNGLVNYKNTYEIYNLIHKGLFIVHQDNIKLFSPGFRAYLLTKKNTSEIYLLHKKLQQASAWEAFRGPLLILLLVIASFVLFTQETLFQKIIALIAGISSLATMLPKIFTGTDKLANKKP